MRFRKRLKLMPGVNLNLSKSGVSASFGRPGASVSVGRQGTHLNVGLPGTGLYDRKKLSGNKSAPSSARSARSSAQPECSIVEVSVIVEDDGKVVFRDQETGDRVSAAVERQVRAQNGERIRQDLQNMAAEENAMRERIRNIHFDSPSPASIHPRAIPFDQPRPKPPSPQRIGKLTRIFLKKRRERLERENLRASSHHDAAVTKWRRAKAHFEETEASRISALDKSIRSDDTTASEWFESQLVQIEWPRETKVAFSLSENLTKLGVDVDLPEIEDLPTQSADVHKTQLRLLRKPLSQKQIRLDYARHVHGVVFRITATAYACLPTLRELTCSAFSQRLDRRTGHIKDEYLVSTIIDRSAWSGLNFETISNVDPILALEEFNLHRKMTATGVFKPITPM